MHLPGWLTPPHFAQEGKTRLAKNLYNILVSIFLFEVIFGILAPFVFPEDSRNALIFIGIALIYTVGCYLLMHSGRVKLASLLFCVFLGGTTLGASLDSNGIDSFTIQTFTVVVLIAGLLLGTRGSLTFAILGSIGVMFIYLVETTGLLPIPKASLPVLLKITIPAFVFIMSAILLLNTTRNIGDALQQAQQHEAALGTANTELQTIRTTLEQRIENRTAQLQASIEIGRTTRNLLDPDQLGEQVVQKITTLLEYDFAAIYLLDNTERWAVLRYASQETPPRMSGQAQPFPVPQGKPAQEGPHRLEMAQSTSVTTAIRTRKPVIPTDLSNPSETTNLLHADMRSEIILPLDSGGRTIGALHLQAHQSTSFNPQEIEILQNVANQIASAFENARLFQETQKQLNEINRLNQLYLQTTWRALLTQQNPAYHFSLGDVKEMETPDSAALEIAQHERKIHLSQENGTSTLVAPIMFQDQVLGAIQLTAQDRTWTTDEQILIEAVLHQTALSLENTRLILETRNRAEQEKMISEISSHMRETLDLETILQTTARDILKTLKLSEVEVRLIPPSTKDTSELHLFNPGE